MSKEIPDTAPGMRMEVELRRSDIGPLGQVRPASYHVLLAEARTALLDRLGLNDRGQFVNVHVDLDHHRALTLGDRHVVITLAVGRIGRSSFEISHDVLKPDGTTCATGRCVLAGWDASTRMSRPLDDADRRALHGARR